MVKQMKAVQQNEFGDPQVLQLRNVPLPKLEKGDILVKVSAVGLNPPDWYLREGYRSLPPEWRPDVTFPLTLGTDLSGVVVAVAEDVTQFGVGDHVYAMVNFPEGMAGESKAYAEYVKVKVEHTAKKPEGISHIEAAAAPMSALTAWQFLVEVGHDVNNPLQPFKHTPFPLKGMKVAINGAAGGVGHFALQIAKQQGAKVVAIASGKHEALLRTLGADNFIDYTKSSPEDILSDLDLVLDCVGGPNTGRFIRVLKNGGALFPVYPLGFTGAEEAIAKGYTVSTTQVRSSGAQLALIGSLFESGQLRSVIDSVYDLEDAQGAHERASQGHIQGKIVLRVNSHE